MGLLFRTEGTRRIIDSLNTAFDSAALQALQNLAGASAYPNGLTTWGKTIQARNWAPYWLADPGNLDLNPKDSNGNSNSTHKARWKIFLTSVLSSTVFATLRDALADAILNHDSSGTQLNIARVSFDHVELEHPNDPQNIVIFDAPLPGAVNKGVVRHITILTPPVP